MRHATCWLDERGKLSLARILLVAAVTFAAIIIVLDSTAWDVPGEAYVLLGTIFTGLLAWTAGPRIAQYVAPQMGAVASGVASAVRRGPPITITPRRTGEHTPGYRRPANVPTDGDPGGHAEDDEP